MSESSLHKSLLVVDGLVISNWSREVFEDMRAGGITAANCTCSVWDNFRDTIENLVQWNRFFLENDDLLIRVNTSAEILRAKRENKIGIILGWQNISGIEDKIGFLQIFHDLGVRVIQLAYNTQNLVGTGCL